MSMAHVSSSSIPIKRELKTGVERLVLESLDSKSPGIKQNRITLPEDVISDMITKAYTSAFVTAWVC